MSESMLDVAATAGLELERLEACGHVTYALKKMHEMLTSKGYNAHDAIIRRLMHQSVLQTELQRVHATMKELSGCCASGEPEPPDDLRVHMEYAHTKFGDFFTTGQFNPTDTLIKLLIDESVLKADLRRKSADLDRLRSERRNWMRNLCTTKQWKRGE